MDEAGRAMVATPAVPDPTAPAPKRADNKVGSVAAASE
jgi:hypothetical protein